ncbi:MAG: hypothetical protein JWM89_4058 [Acidimicrobiales bacterium]|nr:hypothetical protein [Acidimicrobiales bacterium]
MSGEGQPPVRRLTISFLGAGASKAAGLPLTEELLDRIYPRSGPSSWHGVRTQAAWKRALGSAVKVLYPGGGDPAFRPNVSDLFTILEVMASVHSGRERVPLDAETLLRELRLEIAGGLHRMLRRMDIAEAPHTKWFKSANRPSVVITSNWDSLSERAAVEAGLIPLLRWPTNGAGARRQKLRANEIVILKLHGSTDWGRYADRAVTLSPLKDWYAKLDTAVGESTPFGRATKPADLLLRFFTIEGATDGLPSVSGFTSPLMATMAFGKKTQIDALRDLWDDAYWALSRARVLDLVGYSFPDDDLELRALFRTATRRAGRADLDESLTLTVRNPSPEAHDRARQFLGPTLGSDYRGADEWVPGFS